MKKPDVCWSSDYCTQLSKEVIKKAQELYRLNQTEGFNLTVRVRAQLNEKMTDSLFDLLQACDNLDQANRAVRRQYGEEEDPEE